MAVIKTYQSTSYVEKEDTAPIYVSFYIDRKKINSSTVDDDTKLGEILKRIASECNCTRFVGGRSETAKHC